MGKTKIKKKARRMIRRIIKKVRRVKTGISRRRKRRG